MSQGTPSREGRIERHLMRQRGAGVRTITADFGFSFALPAIPLPPAPIQLPVEPPAKRRKTDENISPKRCDEYVLREGSVADAKPREPAEKPAPELVVNPAENEKVVETKEPPRDQSTITVKAPKKSTRARRKFQLDEELEEKPRQKRTGAPKTASVEDTFIFGLKPKRGRPRRQQTEPILEEQLPEPVAEAIPKKRRTIKAQDDVSDEPAGKVAVSEQANAVPPKRGRPEKAKVEVKSEPAVAVMEPDLSAEDVKLVKASRRKAVPEEGPKAVVLDAPTQQVACHDETTHFVKQSIPELVPETKEIAKPSKATRAKPAAKIELPLAVEETEEIAKPQKAAKAKPAAKKAFKRSIEEATADDHDQIIAAVEPLAKRPRRQAAISATQKVVLSYEADLVPTDKLRRAPESGGKIKATSRKAASPMQPSPPSISTTATENTTSCDKVDDALLVSQPAKRGRKPVRHATKNNTAISSMEVDVKSVQDAGTGASSGASTDSGKEVSPSAKPARRGRKPAARATRASVVTSNGEVDVKSMQDAGTRIHSETINKSGKECSPPSQPPQGDSSCKKDAQPAKRDADTSNCDQTPAAVVQVEVQQQAANKKRSTQKRRALAESDVNIIRTSPLKNTEKPVQCASPPAEPRDEYRKATTRPPKKPDQDDTRRSHKPQPAKQSILTPETEPTGGKTGSSKKRHVIAADEDLDWLFEKPETKRPHPATATARQAASKPRRKETDHTAKDMDLDDLLESIAGFSGKLLTGKRGRAVAS